MKTQVPFISTNAISMLLVDDSPMFLHLLEELLERNSYMQVVGTAFTGEEAFKVARAEAALGHHHRFGDADLSKPTCHLILAQPVAGFHNHCPDTAGREPSNEIAG